MNRLIFITNQVWHDCGKKKHYKNRKVSEKASRYASIQLLLKRIRLPSVESRRISKPLEKDGVVVLNLQLKFDDHVSSICRKVSTQIDALID